MNAGRLPLVTLSLVAAALAVDALPWLSDGLVLERARVLDGQLWRLLTGHLVHGLPRLAALDLIALGLLGAWVERRDRRGLPVVLLSSALVASVATLLLGPHERIVGSSALACGLFAAAAVLARREGRAVLALGLGAVLVAKLGLEATGLWSGGLGTLPANLQPDLAAHAGGALGGALAAWTARHGVHGVLRGPGSRRAGGDSPPGPSGSLRIPGSSRSPALPGTGTHGVGS